MVLVAERQAEIAGVPGCDDPQLSIDFAERQPAAGPSP